MHEIITKKVYRREIKLQISRKKDPQKVIDVIQLLLKNVNKDIGHNNLLPEKYRLHKLKGIYNGFWECHIEPDWLLIFSIEDNAIILQRTGAHSDLFNKIRR